jgi:putative transposase
MVALTKNVMAEQRKGSHTVSRLTVHIVWVTKYRYHVLKGGIQKRCRELIIQICDAEDIKILKGAVSKDHVHMHIEYPPSKAISDIVKRLKGRTSRLLQPTFRTSNWHIEYFNEAIGFPEVADRALSQ